MASTYVEIEDHTADTGIEVYADTIEELFLEAGTAFAEMTTPDFTDLGSNIHHSITIEEEDLVNLMHSWLNEMLYLFDSQHFLRHGFVKFGIMETGDTFVLVCTLIGGTFVYGQHEAGIEVKAITWHNLTVEMAQDDTWYSAVIFDI
jgi:SHS2 domain-containing protein